MAANGASAKNPVDFSAPWKFSDVVLVVEDQKFHVHRSTLAFWSPVFEKMFMSEFKEKNNDEISLPGKKASEINQLLHMMYPSLEEKAVTKSNCYFLFELAHEYQIESIAKKCEEFMVSMVKQRTEDDVLAMLIYGQKYQLKSLISTCIYEARRLTLNKLKKHKKRNEIEPDNYAQIAESIIARLEEQCNVTKEQSLKRLEQVSYSLYYHAKIKGKIAEIQYRETKTTHLYLSRLKSDATVSQTQCADLSSVATQLMELKKAIDALP